ncbi:MAG: hypothetical protein GEU95_20405, partial [Rhizobiales bacterium]|nr:hypothetical protein [Hyphomicrobiales bacterium]
MLMRDLDTPAEVKWQPTPDGSADSQLFASLHQAISFVMEKIPAKERATATIDVDGQKTLQLDEIERIYRDPDFARA